MQPLRNMLYRIFDLLTQLPILLKYFLLRKGQPFYWGNSRWYDYEGQFLLPGWSIGRSHDKWIDYEDPLHRESAIMLNPPYPHRHERKRLNDQIIRYQIATSLGAASYDEPICILTSGGTASGKTSAVDTFLNNSDIPLDFFLRIDYDRIKREIPEYPYMLKKRLKNAASYVHLESIKVGGRLFKEAHKERFNIIYEKTLHQLNRAKEDIRKLRSKGYKVYIVATHVPLEIGIARAQKRFQENGRYVPENIIKEIYRDVPSTLHGVQDLVDGIMLFDNSGFNMSLMLYTSEKRIIAINQSQYETYLRCVGAEFDLAISMVTTENTVFL